VKTNPVHYPLIVSASTFDWRNAPLIAVSFHGRTPVNCRTASAG
jgi:hypothetical protein